MPQAGSNPQKKEAIMEVMDSIKNTAEKVANKDLDGDGKIG